MKQATKQAITLEGLKRKLNLLKDNVHSSAVRLYFNSHKTEKEGNEILSKFGFVQNEFNVFLPLNNITAEWGRGDRQWYICKTVS